MHWHDILSQALQQGLGPVAAVYCLAAIGLNVHFGYTGLLNFGQAGFMAVGGYAVSSFVATWGLSFWLGSLVGLLAAGVLALLLGVPTLRLRADYLAIVTIGSVTLLEYFGGQDGLQGFNDSFAGLNPFTGSVGIPGVVSWRPYDFWTLLVCWLLVALCCLMVWALMRSPWGRVLKGIREDEDAVRSLGKNVYAYKMQSLLIGGLIGGLAGIMSALQHSAINPSFFETDTTFFAYTVLLVGGAARVLGPVAGTIVFWFLLSFLDLFFGAATSPSSGPLIPDWLMTSNQASLVRFIFMGLALMLLMVFRPQGIFGDRRELALDAR
jgi:ABC-type branched-subunit amino acid transport system permease subunit